MKIAVIFPGIGYHTDKPLLYYSKKIARESGYEIVEVPYGNFPSGVKGSKDKMREAFSGALKQAEDILQDVKFSKYDEVLFISKSVGTAVAGTYARMHDLKTRNVYYTPVTESLLRMQQEGIVFHGTNDGWADTAFVVESCERMNYPLYLTENANHSLETGDVIRDLENLRDIMKKTKEYIDSI